MIVAANEPAAIIIKKGPAQWTQLVLWDTRNDVFTAGAWIRGRIYAEKCDLSPDGQLFLYAIHQGRRFATDTTHSYTALSRAPWLHALVLWPRGTTYGGGGRFTGDRRLTLRGEHVVHPDYSTRGLEIIGGASAAHRSTDEVEDAEWSGRDHAGRLIFTRAGSVFASVEDRDVLLTHFDAERPDPQPAPEWATRPLE